jgi:hypothetical protein
MDIQENTDQAARTPSVTVDFSHRLLSAQIADRADLSDTVGPMAERTLGVLHSIAIQFEGSHGGRVSNELVSGALSAAIHEVMDIRAAIDAYCDAEQVKELV